MSSVWSTAIIGSIWDFFAMEVWLFNFPWSSSGLPLLGPNLVFCSHRKPCCLTTHPWANANGLMLSKVIFPNTFPWKIFWTQSAIVILNFFVWKTLKANVMSFVLSLNFAISKVNQKALMGKGNFFNPNSYQADLILTSDIRTKLFMHGDYQLAYCLITQIILFAFHNGAFFNTELTPELIWQLQVPNHCLSLPLQWKPKVLNMPLLWCLEQTPYSYKLHGSLLMTYESSQEALRELGRDAWFKNNIGHYNFRRWTANEVNCMLLIECNLMKPFPLSGTFLCRV